MPVGRAEPAPGARSFTCRVPARVPSVRHSSVPEPAVLALKKSVAPFTVSLVGDEPVAPALTSSSVACVPS